MINKNTGLMALILVAVVLISGCSQGGQKEPAPKTQATLASTPIETPTATPTPLPTQVSVGGDVLGSELAKSDTLESDATDSELDSLNSDLGEIESGL